jgi:hypothetical protein
MRSVPAVVLLFSLGPGEEFRGKSSAFRARDARRCWFDGHRRVAFGQTVNVLSHGTDDEESARVVTIAT